MGQGRPLVQAQKHADLSGSATAPHSAGGQQWAALQCFPSTAQAGQGGSGHRGVGAAGAGVGRRAQGPRAEWGAPGGLSPGQQPQGLC